MLSKKDLQDITRIIQSDNERQAEKINKEFRKINKQFTELFNFLDKDLMKLKKRVDRIEGHLKLPPLS